MKRIIQTLFCFFLCVGGTFAATKTAADSAYAAKNYVEAVNLYEQVLRQGVSAEVFYNLGNAYFRLKDNPKAILNYRRALKYEPAFQDARFNLSLCESKLTDRFEQPEEMFFVTWFRSFWQGRSADGWAIWAIATLIGALLFSFLYFFGRRMLFRKLGFSVALLLLILSCTFNVFAYMQKKRFTDERQIVLSAPCTVFSNASFSSKVQRELHEGTSLVVLDTFSGGWMQVRLPDGTVGWVQSRGVLNV